MDFSVGQKVYIKEKANNFRLLSQSGDVIFINNFQELVLVRFKNNEQAYFTEDNLSLTFIFPSSSSIVTVVLIIILLSFVLADLLSIYILKESFLMFLPYMWFLLSLYLS